MTGIKEIAINTALVGIALVFVGGVVVGGFEAAHTVEHYEAADTLTLQAPQGTTLSVGSTAPILSGVIPGSAYFNVTDANDPPVVIHWPVKLHHPGRPITVTITLVPNLRP